MSAAEPTGPTLPAPGTVTMFTTTWCGYCRRLKSQMEREGIGFTEVDIEREPGTAEFVMSVNGGNQTVPTLLFPDGSAATNPSIAQVRDRLRLSRHGSARRLGAGHAGQRSGISGESSGPPNQCSMIRREIEMRPDTTTDPSASAATSSSRVNHRAASISSACSRRSVPSAAGREAEHERRRERPRLVAEVGDVGDLDPDLLAPPRGRPPRRASRPARRSRPAPTSRCRGSPCPRASRSRSSASTTAMITAMSVRG